MLKNENIAVVTPSYKEDENIDVLLGQINTFLPGAKVFVVDDSDAEDNKKIAKIVSKYKNAVLISRLKKMGRGSAIITGFKEALKNKNILYFFEMDSDLAHSPKEFDRYLSKLKEKKYDLIIGSRYLNGAKTIGISHKRRIMSAVINNFLYFWLNVHISDFTGGFRLYSRKSVEYLTSLELKSKGFITLSEIAYRLRRKGYLIAEVPITINNVRRFGESTVNSNELISSLSFVLEMRIKDLVSEAFKT